MNHVMIDLESLGTDPDTIFTCLGACKFDPATGEISPDYFYQRIDWDSAIAAGRTHSLATLKWWLGNTKDAQNELLTEGLPLDVVLAHFRVWLPKNCIVWGKGPTFDITILEHAYGYGNAPWKFWNIRDVRTVIDLADGILAVKDVAGGFPGTAHNALEDAVFQATYVCAMWKALREGKPG